MTFRRNPNFIREFARSPSVRAYLRRSAEKARRPTEALTHHAMPRKGHRRIEVVESDGEVYLVNTNHGGHLEEWGLARTPMYAPLRRGVRAAGFRLGQEN